ncbi:XRE family transcriptional regulator [Streptomyces malaysiensis subsp. malaysiensis]|uniref:helix-turn-helix domain-containing protein n=1 Tax=Streptomyces malaysiensis TaxID=92644 RepID=UPI000BFBDFD3|nr:helix-turn-helix transcriptional regulator [Streptomyces malaysiensis]QDL75469.1 XRE family transcriptional regulator [Streptomyces malaysiensis]
MPARKSVSGRKPSARLLLAAEVARLREESGKSLGQLADETTYDRTYLHKLETGVRIGSPEVIAALDRVYATGERLSMLWELARDDVFPDKYKRFMELEATATVRYEYAVSTVPGLLQTKEYAREVFWVGRPRSEDELEEQVAARVGRQELLTRDDPPHYRAVLDEAVLRRPTRDPKVWKQQLDHLLETAMWPNVTLQVLPFAAGLHDLLGGSLTVLWLPDGSSVGYVESSKTGELVENAADVEQLKLSYDLLRDLALSPRETVAFIRQVMEDSAPCDPLAQI